MYVTWEIHVEALRTCRTNHDKYFYEAVVRRQGFSDAVVVAQKIFTQHRV